MTMGDPAGISGEIIVTAHARMCAGRDALARRVKRELTRKRISLVVAGDAGYLSWHAKRMRSRIAVRSIAGVPRSFTALSAVECIPVTSIDMKSFRFGECTYGRESIAYIDHAVAEAKRGAVAAIVTAPVTKAAVAKVLPDFRGHTEYLSEAFGAADTRMAFYTPDFILALETVHIPLSKVASSITAASVAKSLALIAEAGRRRYGKRAPIAVLALNPHAGEHGLMGSEDDGVIAEGMAALPSALGPFPADSFFIERYKSFKLILAMYHDQGLIPVKALYPRASVNVTLGLPVVRTSVDHGSAYDIAGKGRASADGLLHAISAAIELT
ncbi:MAG: 4-hydroxythreonine-4-phosphate dehydrogenase PdxA [Spirochaetota bacterium]